jgi:hypothetical protein
MLNTTPHALRSISTNTFCAIVSGVADLDPYWETSQSGAKSPVGAFIKHQLR